MLSKPTKPLPIAIVENPLGTIAQALDFRTYNTPKILRTGMFVIWGLGLVWIPTTIGAMQLQRKAVKTIAQDSVPSVILAQRIIDAMSDMDNMVASDLLRETAKPVAGTAALTEPNGREKSQTFLSQAGNMQQLTPAQKALLTDEQQAFNKRRDDLAERLTLAAKNSTFEGEKEAIQQLMLDAGDYFTYAERSQVAHAQGDRAEMLEQYQLAAQLLDRKFIPTAHELRDINSRELEKEYSASRVRGAGGTIAVTLLGVTTIAALAALQLFLYIRTRRTLNPLLLGATIGALLFLLNAITTLVSTGEQIRVLKEDSYNTLLALRLARELLYGANSDESRYLLDPANQAKHEAAFQQKTHQVFSGSDNQTVMNSVITKLKNNQSIMGNEGHFVTTFQNITFAAERVPLTKMMEEYKTYMAIDQQIRTLVASKNLPAAIKLCLGESNVVFDNTKKAMDVAKDVNQDIFNQVEKKAMGQLSNYEVKATIALGAMATLVFFGLRPRMREYL
jgi:hypothetical protein